MRLNKTIHKVKRSEMEITYYDDETENEVNFLLITNKRQLTPEIATHGSNKIIIIGR